MSYANDFEDYEEDAFEEALGSDYWPAKDGKILIAEMHQKHIYNAIRLCNYRKRIANSTHEQEVFESWIEIFEEELKSRPKSLLRPANNLRARGKK